MATGSFTIPPTFPLLPGAAVSILNQTGAIPLTVLFTAHTSGLYLVGGNGHTVSTNGIGTLAFVLTFPHAPAIGFAPTLSPLQDNPLQILAVWLNAGEQITFSATESGVTGTVYDVFVIICQAL